MKDCPFIPRKITEYESELGPKLLLIAEKPLPTDKMEIFDSIQARSYLDEVFKSKFKLLETHISYINPNPADYDFARGMFFNILGHYAVKKTLDIKKLAIGFIGQEAFEAFKKEYLSIPDSNGSYLYINEQKKIIKLNFTLLHNYVVEKYGTEEKNNDILIPYVILPNITDEISTIHDILNSISFVHSLPDSPYCDTNQIITRLEYLLEEYEGKAIKHFTFDGKTNGNKLEYFSISDDYLKESNLQYRPHDEIMCANDSEEDIQKVRDLLRKVLTTIPVSGKNASKLVDLFPFRNEVKVLSDDDTESAEQYSNSIQVKEFKLDGDYNGSEPSEWYTKWYKEAFPDIIPGLRELVLKLHRKRYEADKAAYEKEREEKEKRGITVPLYKEYEPLSEKDITKAIKLRIEKEGYSTKEKYEWIYDIEVFQEDWLFVAKTLDGKNKLICWNDGDKLHDWVQNKILIGFNNAQYDDSVIRHAMNYPYMKDQKNNTVKKYSDALILHGAKPGYPEMNPMPHWNPNFLSWDISFHGPFDIRRNSLKKLTMSVLNKRNYDSSVSFDIARRLTPAERLDVEKYCEMDVDNTLALFMPDPDNPKRTYAKESYDIRWNMIVEYKMRAKTLINKSSSFAGKLLCGEDAEPNTNNKWRYGPDGKLQYYSIPEIAYKELADDPLGKPLLQFYIDHQQDPNYIKEKYELYMGGNDEGHKYQFGFGGLHQALIGYRSKNLVNMDVASLYPSLLVQYNLMSRGASKNPKSYEEVYHTRLKAKKEGKTLLNQGLKLILNGAIGAFLSDFNPLYDTWSNSSICVHGQLMLFILARRLFNAGFNIVQVNTDGIMIEKRDDVDYEPITTAWQEETRLVLEFDEIDTLAQNNVNNYYCKFTNGKVKSKGFYLSNEKFGKATSKILCNLVTDQPLLDGVEPRDYVIFKKHAIGEIYDGITNKKLDGRSLAFVVGKDDDIRTQSYYSRSKNAKWVEKKDENGNIILNTEGKPILEEVHAISKITGFNDHMLLVDDINTLTMDEINPSAYIAFAKNLLDQADDFGPYFTADYEKVEEPDVLQALNAFKDNTDVNPRNSNVYCQNLLFECDDLTKEEQEEIIERNKDILYRVVWSGNRSYHCVVRLSRPVTSLVYKKIWQYIQYKYRWYGADEQANVPSKYTRVPDQMNPKTGEMQTLYSYDKNILDVDQILDEIPRINDKALKPFKEYTGKISLDALKKHINKLDWSAGNRFAACQHLSPRLIGQVSMNELLDMIPDGNSLDKDHLYVIKCKYRFYEQHKDELLKEE